MARESRDAVISVRISEDDQARLREVASERGTSVSELVRSVVLREVTEQPAPTATVTRTTAPRPDHGLHWANQEGAVISGGTITLSR